MKGWFHSSALRSPLGLELSPLSLASGYDAIRERKDEGKGGKGNAPVSLGRFLLHDILLRAHWPELSHINTPREELCAQLKIWGSEMWRKEQKRSLLCHNIINCFISKECEA